MCLRAQSSEFWSVCSERGDCSQDASSTDGFGEEVRDVFITGNETDLQEFLSDEVSDKMKAQVHMFGSESVLTDLTEGQINGASVVNVNGGQRAERAGDDFRSKVLNPDNIFTGIGK